MRIEIDVREKELIDILKVMNSMNGTHEIIIKALPIGDIIIYDDINTISHTLIRMQRYGDCLQDLTVCRFHT